MVIKLLERLGRATYEDLVKELVKEGVIVDSLSLRKVLANLIKNGVVVKVPNPQRMKFEYMLSSRSYPED